MVKDLQLQVQVVCKVARCPWAPRTFLEFAVKTSYVLEKHFVVFEYFPVSLNSCEIVI